MRGRRRPSAPGSPLPIEAENIAGRRQPSSHLHSSFSDTIGSRRARELSLSRTRYGYWRSQARVQCETHEHGATLAVGCGIGYGAKSTGRADSRQQDAEGSSSLAAASSEVHEGAGTNAAFAGARCRLVPTARKVRFSHRTPSALYALRGASVMREPPRREPGRWRTARRLDDWPIAEARSTP